MSSQVSAVGGWDENFTLSISPHSESDVLCEREEPNDKSQMTQ